MKLVRFERPDGSAVYVNPACISTVTAADKPAHTHLTLGGAMQIVRGKVEDVITKLTGGSDA
jgi:uncharacterized protein YlzI (FlbEa/FlbD family)